MVGDLETIPEEHLELAQSVKSPSEAGERRVDVAELATLVAAYGKPPADFFVDQLPDDDPGPQ